MRFSATQIPGVMVVEPELHEDHRGFFARIFCREELRAQGLVDHLEQVSFSYNRHRGTVRGMHFQAAPHGESKLVACMTGSIFDVAVDVRPGSPGYGQWFGAELSARNRRMLYLPAGIAHGFQTLADDCTVLYQISAPFRPEAGRGIRWNDPRVGIAWPLLEGVTIAERDQAWPDWPPDTG